MVSSILASALPVVIHVDELMHTHLLPFGDGTSSSTMLHLQYDGRLTCFVPVLSCPVSCVILYAESELIGEKVSFNFLYRAHSSPHVLGEYDQKICEGLIQSGSCYKASSDVIWYHGNRDGVLIAYVLGEFLGDALSVSVICSALMRVS